MCSGTVLGAMTNGSSSQGSDNVSDPNARTSKNQKNQVTAAIQATASSTPVTALGGKGNMRLNPVYGMPLEHAPISASRVGVNWTGDAKCES